jgi:hypothetical protein
MTKSIFSFGGNTQGKFRGSWPFCKSLPSFRFPDLSAANLRMNWHGPSSSCRTSALAVAGGLSAAPPVDDIAVTSAMTANGNSRVSFISLTAGRRRMLQVPPFSGRCQSGHYLGVTACPKSAVGPCAVGWDSIMNAKPLKRNTHFSDRDSCRLWICTSRLIGGARAGHRERCPTHWGDASTRARLSISTPPKWQVDSDSSSPAAQWLPDPGRIVRDSCKARIEPARSEFAD